MTKEYQNFITAKRILFDLGIDTETMQQRTIQKDGTSLIYLLELIRCETEDEVQSLINRYL